MAAIRTFVLTWIFAALSLHAGDIETVISPETKSFDAIHEALSKTRAGRDKPTDTDLATRRAAGAQTAEKAKEFIRVFPNSKKVGEANALWNIGLFQSAVAGDTNSAAALKQRQREI